MTKTDIANGEGVRCVLWVAGCDVRCEGCHNPQSWDFCAGKPFDKAALEEFIDAVSRPWVNGVTLSGGHPLAPENLSDVYEVCKAVREKCPGKTIWLYTGYNLDISDFDTHAIRWGDAQTRTNILAMCDVVVDGNYNKAMRDISLRFRGSSNQRIIDVKKTIESYKICLWEDENGQKKAIK